MLLVCMGCLGCVPWFLGQVHNAAYLHGLFRLCSLVSGPSKQGCLFAWVVFLGFWAKYTTLLGCIGCLGCIPWCLDQVDKGACLHGLLRLCSLVFG
jgi:hypothetical protein